VTSAKEPIVATMLGFLASANQVNERMRCCHLFHTIYWHCDCGGKDRDTKSVSWVTMIMRR